MQRIKLVALASVVLAGVGTLAMAQTQHDHTAPAQPGMMQGQHMQMMQGQPMPMMQRHGTVVPANATPATRAYIAVVEKMHHDMNITYGGNADRDFVAGMIPHHESAVAMARVVLGHGADPAVRALAESIIRDQEREIVQLRTILQRLPAP